MATIFDLFEVTTISGDTTYSTANGNLLGIVDNVSSADLNDGEFDEGDSILINGVSYTIDRIQEPSSSGRFVFGNGSEQSFDPGSESNLSVAFLTVSNGSDIRHFIIPNDSYGDMNVQQIRTGNLNDVAGSDAAIISTTNNDTQIVCFVAGTEIDTPDGAVLIEDLDIGDLVLTRNNGPQAIRAIIARDLALDDSSDRRCPIAFEVNALGPGRPYRRLCVSPQHRILVTDQAGQTVLVPAKALLGRRGVRIMHGKRFVTYIHLVFSQHEIIYANGTLTESLLPGAMALEAIPESSQRELYDIFGTALDAQTNAYSKAAAPILRFQDARRRALTFSQR